MVVARLTGEEGEPSHGRKRVVAGGVQYVQLVDLVSNPIQFTVEVLNGRSVGVLKLVVQEPVNKETLSKVTVVPTAVKA